MSTKNQFNDEAKKKIKTLVRDIKIGLLATNLKKPPISAVPMTTNRVDIEGNIWFLSSGDSEHNRNIAKNNNVQLFYAKPSSAEFLNVNGKAEIVIVDSVLDDLYDSVSNNWFNGAKDPNLTAIKVVPHEAYYWDTKTNKYVALFKLGLSALTGRKADVGEKGKLNV